MARSFGGEVVGIVGDVRQTALEQGVTPHIYMSYDQWPLNEFAVVVRSVTPWRTVLGATRSVLARIDGNVPMNGARSLDDLVAASLGERRFYLTLLIVFAAVAVVLALAGVYGVIAYGVQQRKREIGIRLALGASRERVLAMVVGEGLRLASIGAVLGVLAALPLTRLLDALVFGVGTRDPLTLVIAPTALIAAATIACLVPARSAARLDPVETIRAD